MLKGFLLRRLSTLVMDNLDQFTEAQLVSCAYRLAGLKFLTSTNFNSIYKCVENKFEEFPDHVKIEVCHIISIQKCIIACGCGLYVPRKY